ncbi:MAG TPA: alginate export family protein [Bryobacteraceae bacterium]|nr:alginate export family protein [Bryobacteraceae bacterium]
MRFVICLVSCVTFGANLAAQTDQADPLHIGPVDVTGTIHERYEDWDFFPSKGESSYGYSGSLIRVLFSHKEKSYDWGVELAAPILLGIPDHAVVAAPQGQLGLGGSYYAANHNEQNSAFVFIKQAYVHLKGEHSSVKLGRYEFFDGGEVKPKDATLAIVKRDGIAQRLIGTFGFADVHRSVDGAVYAYANGPWNFTVFSGIPDRGVFQVDGWGWVKTPFTYAALTRQEHWGRSNAEWRVFGIYYNDDRGVLKTDNRPAAVRAADPGAINIGTYGGHYIQAIPTAAGTIDLLGWGALQTGRWGVQTQRSGAGAVEGGFQPKIAQAVRPWVRGGYFYSTGDGNPNDGVHATFFALLPTPRVYARFPFYNEMNNRDLFAYLMLRPRKDLTFRTDVHGIWLANGHDLWYAGGGAFQPWTFGFSGRPANGSTGLATIYDISADYQMMRAVSLGLYFGYARGGAVVEHIFPAGRDAKFGYVEVNYQF